MKMLLFYGGIILLLLVFACFIYNYNKKIIDGFNNDNKNLKKRCPDVLIQKGPKFYLFNSKIAKVPGVNPIEFNNLEEYVTFLKWQKNNNIRCPVLFLQQSFDAQGNIVYNSKNTENYYNT
jgi:hypothetical protein